MNMERELIINGDPYRVDVLENEKDRLVFRLDGVEYVFARRHGGRHLVMTGNGRNHRVRCCRADKKVQVNIGPLEAFVEIPGARQRERAGSADQVALRSPMPGRIYKILAEEGSRVKKGDKILILEAMKMEQTLLAHRDGILTRICFAEGEQVEGDVELAVIKPEEPE